MFELCCEISIAEVKFHFNSVRNCRSAIAELRCASTESTKIHCGSCALEIKKIKLRILRFTFTG